MNEATISVQGTPTKQGFDAHSSILKGHNEKHLKLSKVKLPR